ncbi:MAG: nucleotidyltransferase domain-containing protein [Crenarchaeota archaeon]|nr:nucleotidyltransferase domain-containing protein [Thermoproteota archaeon]
MSDIYEIVKDCLVEAFLKVIEENLVSIVLYGSYARREARQDSDVDVIIVLEKLPEDRFELHKKLDEVEDLFWRCLSRRGVYIRPVISPVILDRERANTFRPLYIDAIFDAEILYDKDNFMSNVLERVRKKLSKLGARRERIGKIWYVVLKPNYKPGEVIDLSLEDD